MNSLTTTHGDAAAINQATQERLDKSSLWRQALRQRSVWRRTLKVGLSVGVLQAMVNQGDHWMRHAVTTTVVIKTILSPLICITLVLFTSAATWVQKAHETHHS
jgi:hypothetical protein